MGHKGHWGEYTGNTKWSKDHAHTRVTKEDYKASERDDAAHIDYLKRDVDYDDKHGHSDEDMTADEKHISKLAGDMKYDKEHHGSPAHAIGSPLYKRPKPSKPRKPSGTKPKPQLPAESPVYQDLSETATKTATARAEEAMVEFLGTQSPKLAMTKTETKKPKKKIIEAR